MRRILSPLTVALALAPVAASAATLTATITESATVIAGCTALSVGTNLSFGSTIVPGQTPTATGGLSSTCSSGVTAKATFDNGLNAGAGSIRNLVNSANTAANSIAYALYSNSTETTAVTSTGITITGTGAALATPVYAKTNAVIPSGQVAGTYTDSVGVTLTF